MVPYKNSTIQKWYYVKGHHIKTVPCRYGTIKEWYYIKMVSYKHISV